MLQKKLTGKKLTRALDQAIRDLLKLQHSNPTCFVCGKNTGWFHPQKNTRGCQVGHYVSRRYFALRWDLKNIFSQCAPCNYNHNNDPSAFSSVIVTQFGAERLNYYQQKIRECREKPLTTLQKRALLEQLQAQIAELSSD